MAKIGKNPENKPRGYSFISIFSWRWHIAKITQKYCKKYDV